MAIETVPGAVIVGVTSPAFVMSVNVSSLVHPCERRYRTASRAPFPESSASEPSGLKMRSSATCFESPAGESSRIPPDPCWGQLPRQLLALDDRVVVAQRGPLLEAHRASLREVQPRRDLRGNVL